MPMWAISAACLRLNKQFVFHCIIKVRVFFSLRPVMQVIGLFYGNSPMKLVVCLLVSSAVLLSACQDQSESISPTQLGTGIGLQGSVISPLRFSNPYPQISAQCYTETSRGVQNTGQYCHTNAVYKAELGNTIRKQVRSHVSVISSSNTRLKLGWRKSFAKCRVIARIGCHWVS